jgi:hypothetical protein
MWRDTILVWDHKTAFGIRVIYRMQASHPFNALAQFDLRWGVHGVMHVAGRSIGSMCVWRPMPDRAGRRRDEGPGGWEFNAAVTLCRRRSRGRLPVGNTLQLHQCDQC